MAARKRAKRKTASKKATRSSKGKLVKGTSEILPIELLSEPHFKDKLTELIRGYAGVYLLYRGGELYYIGLARSLYGRLRQHTKDKHAGNWDAFAIYRINRVQYLKDIESLLIRIARPPGNAVKGHFHRDADMTKMLREIARIQKKRLDAISKSLSIKH